MSNKGLFELTGKTALVTGCKRGIGRAMASALAGAGADIIGVNSRDLRTLNPDLGVARKLAGLGGDALLIAESGIESRADIDDLSTRGYKGFLVGTSLMRSSDPGESLKELLGAH